MPRKTRYDRDKARKQEEEILANPPRNIRKAKTDVPLLKTLARIHTKDALDQLVKIMRKSKYPGLQLQAIEQILNRGWGKPAQALAGADGDGPIEIDIKEIRRTIVDPEEFDEEDITPTKDTRPVERQSYAAAKRNLKKK